MDKPGQPIHPRLRPSLAGAPIPPGEPRPTLPHATPAPAAHDFHCHDHPHFTPACLTCQRARANNLPYRNIDPHPPASSRSFASTIGPSGFAEVPSLTLREIAGLGAADGIAESLTDALLDHLL